MDPKHEPMRGEITGVTTARLIEQSGPIVARVWDHRYQAIELADGKMYESFRFKDTWLPWSRRPCHSMRRLAKAMGLDYEQDPQAVYTR